MIEQLDAKYKRLSQEEADALPFGSAVFVLWSGGNGPHMYFITDKCGNHSHIAGLSSVSGALGFVGKEKPFDIVWLVQPTEQEYAEIFRHLFETHLIPTRVKNFVPFVCAMKKRNTCSGPDIEWIIMRAHRFARGEKRNAVTRSDLFHVIAEPNFRFLLADIDRVVAAALEACPPELRPTNWQRKVEYSWARLASRAKSDTEINR